MKRRALKFLETLLDAPSPSGFEGPARRAWLHEVKKTAQTTAVDVHGNAMATLNPRGRPHVMLAGHIDEIGFQICHIERNGFLRFRAIGGHDMRAVAGRRVQIHTATGPILGVIGKTPIHLIQDRQKPQSPPKIASLWIDAGFIDGDAAATELSLGDPVTYLEGFAPLRDQLVVARALDNKVGSFVVAEVIRRLAAQEKLAAKVTSVATVQEEIGLRGAYTSTFGLKPDVGIAVDVTWATDNPGGEAKEIGKVALGAGPVLFRGPNANPALLAMLQHTADEEQIPVQIRALPRAAGNDANAMQISGAGLAAAIVGIPQRYMHTPVEICSLDDLEAAVALIAGAISRMNRRSSFIPD